MTNKTKIIVVILIIAIIVVSTIAIVKKTKTEENKAHENEETINNLVDKYIDGNQENYTNNIIEENNTVENLTTENKANNEQNVIFKNTVIGKEEQESNNENTEATDRQQAINLAKQEWGISIDSYDFQAELKEDKYMGFQ